MLSHRFGRRALLGIAGALSLALVGCGGSDLSKPFGTDPNDTNKERALNALVGGPSAAVDIAQRSANINPTPLAFGQSSSYVSVSSGISIKTNAYQSGTTTQVAPEASVTMTRDFFYTEAVAGIFGTSGATAPRLFQFSDNFPSTIAAGNVALRLVNLSPDSPPLTLYNISGTPATAIAIAGLGSVSYGNMSSSGGSNYITATAGAYNLTVRDSAGNVVATLGPVALNGGHAYSVFVYGLVSPTASQPAAQATLLTDL